MVVGLLIASNATPCSAQNLLVDNNTCVASCNTGTWESLAISLVLPQSYDEAGKPSSVMCSTTVYMRRLVCYDVELGLAKVIMYLDGACTECSISSASKFLEAIMIRAINSDNPLGAFVLIPNVSTNIRWVTRGCWSTRRNCGTTGDKYCIYRCDCGGGGVNPVEGNCRNCCQLSVLVQVNTACDITSTTTRSSSYPGDCESAIRPISVFETFGCSSPVNNEDKCESACPFQLSTARDNNQP